MKSKLHNIYAGGLVKPSAYSLVGSSVSLGLYEAWLVDSVSFLVISLNLLAPTTPPPPLTEDSLSTNV